MARRSLKPQLNQIRAWVRQGRTDAWIAHQLEVTVAELREFRGQHDLKPDDDATPSGEIELRDEIEAEVEAATAEEAAEAEEPEAEEPEAEELEAEEDESEEPAGEDEGKPREDEEARDAEEPAGEDGGTASRTRRRRRRGKRGGRGRRRELEAAFDHGERDGYGLWLDPSVKDNPVYAEHWAGKREVTVRIEPDQIVIRRSGENGSDSED
jgi:hypothetical protein